jgi:predicted NAD/FAD-binding protein
MKTDMRVKVAVVGTGISGLSAAWLLNQRHDVTVYERADRVGGHSNTILAPIDDRLVPVDTGFIVFNRLTYPNLTALFEHLKVPVKGANMSFAVSLDDGRFEYSGSGLSGLFGQATNLARPRFWTMLADVVRFYRNAPHDPALIDNETMSLGDYLEIGQYGTAFRDLHILPMASAIWSAKPAELLSYPAASFVRFYHNHGLLKLRRRPPWETVDGGSRLYVERLTRSFADRIRLNTAVVSVRRAENGPIVTDSSGHSEHYDHVVMATHADQTLSLLSDPTEPEREILGAFRYSRNLAVLHRDQSFMPKRRSIWSSWNYLGSGHAARDGVCVTYWMNQLQSLPTNAPLFVTLNPPRPPRTGTIFHSEVYDHPIFDAQALAAQRRLWLLQGKRQTWFCGAHFGAGFHEDGLQSGLAVAEQLGGMLRPWDVPDQSGRIQVLPSRYAAELSHLEAAE